MTSKSFRRTLYDIRPASMAGGFGLDNMPDEINLKNKMSKPKTEIRASSKKLEGKAGQRKVAKNDATPADKADKEAAKEKSQDMAYMVRNLNSTNSQKDLMSRQIEQMYNEQMDIKSELAKIGGKVHEPTDSNLTKFIKRKSILASRIKYNKPEISIDNLVFEITGQPVDVATASIQNKDSILAKRERLFEDLKGKLEHSHTTNEIQYWLKNTSKPFNQVNPGSDFNYRDSKYQFLGRPAPIKLSPHLGPVRPE